MALLSMAIQKRGEDAISFTGSQSGIITNDRHFDARIIEVRPHRVEDELAPRPRRHRRGLSGNELQARDHHPRAAGGSRHDGAWPWRRRWGRSHAEIYSDVDGVYSADPRQVSEDARSTSRRSRYEEMQDAWPSAGAKVLHAEGRRVRAQGGHHHPRALHLPARPARQTVVRDARGARRARQARWSVPQGGWRSITLEGDGRAFTGSCSLTARAGRSLEGAFSAIERPGSQQGSFWAVIADVARVGRALRRRPRRAAGALIEEGLKASSAWCTARASPGGGTIPALAAAVEALRDPLRDPRVLTTPLRLSALVPDDASGRRGGPRRSTTRLVEGLTGSVL